MQFSILARQIEPERSRYLKNVLQEATKKIKISYGVHLVRNCREMWIKSWDCLPIIPF